MTDLLIESLVMLGGEMPQYPTEVVKNEPMLFSCDADHAWLLGGPITKDFIERLPPEVVDRDDFIFDSRVHMLMKGWWPCIPGFHHDDVPRRASDGQPDYFTPDYRSQHAAAIVGDDVSRTEFALGKASFPVPEDGEIFYKVWHPLVEEKLEKGELVRFAMPMQRIVYFDDRTWHQGTVSKGAGWRWFGRASWDTERVHSNEERRQVQVYLANPMEGW